MTWKIPKQHLYIISRSPRNRVQSCLWPHRIRGIRKNLWILGNFELDFWAIGWLYLGAAFDVSNEVIFVWVLSDGYLDTNWSSYPFQKVSARACQWFSRTTLTLAVRCQPLEWPGFGIFFFVFTCFCKCCITTKFFHSNQKSSKNISVYSVRVCILSYHTRKKHPPPLQPPGHPCVAGAHLSSESDWWLAPVWLVDAELRQATATHRCPGGCREGRFFCLW